MAWSKYSIYNKCSFGRDDRGQGYRNEKSYLGFGFMFVNDVGGDANFGLRNGGIMSGVIPVNRLHTFSAGLQTSFGNRVADLTNLTFYLNGMALLLTLLY